MQIIKLIRNISFSPNRTLEDISNGGEFKFSHAVIIYFLSCIIPIAKSFQKPLENFNFFTNETLNTLLDFYSRPQVQVVTIFMSYILLIFLIRLVSNLIAKSSNRSNVAICLLSLSGVGMLMHLFILICGAILPHTIVKAIWVASLMWVVILSIISIKICQKTTVLKAIAIYFVSGLPVIIISGFTGLAPALLWATQP